MKTRLNADHRRALANLARKLVACPAETKALAAAYKKAAPLIMRDITEKYPVRDMNVLAKYERATRDDCIRIQMTSGGITQFHFEKDKGPLTPRGYCQIYATKVDTTDAVQDWQAAGEAEKEALAKKLGDYQSLIDFSRTLDDIEAVWPEAAQLRGSIVANLPVALSPDVVARIVDDVAQRAEAA